MHRNLHTDPALDRLVDDIDRGDRDERRRTRRAELSLTEGATSRDALRAAGRRATTGLVAAGTAGVLLTPVVGTGIAAAEEGASPPVQRPEAAPVEAGGVEAPPEAAVSAEEPVAAVTDANAEGTVAAATDAAADPALIDEPPLDGPTVDTPALPDMPTEVDPSDDPEVEGDADGVSVTGDVSDTTEDSSGVDPVDGGSDEEVTSEDDDSAVDDTTGDDTTGDDQDGEDGPLTDIVDDALDTIVDGDDVEEDGDAGEVDDGSDVDPPAAETPGGEVPEGELPGLEVPEGELPEGELPEGEPPGLEVPEGELPEGELPEGERPEGERPGLPEDVVDPEAVDVPSTPPTVQTPTPPTVQTPTPPTVQTPTPPTVQTPTPPTVQTPSPRPVPVPTPRPAPTPPVTSLAPPSVVAPPTQAPSPAPPTRVDPSTTPQGGDLVTPLVLEQGTVRAVDPASSPNARPVVRTSLAQMTTEQRIKQAQQRPVDAARVDAWSRAVTDAWSRMQADPSDQEGPVLVSQDVADRPTLGWSYEIQAGDSLWTISQALWGVDTLTSSQVEATWQLIYTWNADRLGADPDAITTGTVIQIPIDAQV